MLVLTNKLAEVVDRLIESYACAFVINADHKSKGSGWHETLSGMKPAFSSPISLLRLKQYVKVEYLSIGGQLLINKGSKRKEHFSKRLDELLGRDNSEVIHCFGKGQMNDWANESDIHFSQSHDDTTSNSSDATDTTKMKEPPFTEANEEPGQEVLTKKRVVRVRSGAAKLVQEINLPGVSRMKSSSLNKEKATQSDCQSFAQKVSNVAHKMESLRATKKEITRSKSSSRGQTKNYLRADETRFDTNFTEKNTNFDVENYKDLKTSFKNLDSVVGVCSTHEEKILKLKDHLGQWQKLAEIKTMHEHECQQKISILEQRIAQEKKKRG